MGATSRVLSTIVCLVPAVAVVADPVRYTPDRWHTRIYFEISHMGLSDYQGRFVDYEFDFLFDEQDFARQHDMIRKSVRKLSTEHRSQT